MEKKMLFDQDCCYNDYNIDKKHYMKTYMFGECGKI